MSMTRRLALALALSLSTASFGAPAWAADPVPAVTANDRILGRVDAPVTVIEYASFTCPHCAAWHNDVLPAFKARFIDTGQVRLVFRDLPTQPARVAATVAGIARCAEPARFFDVAASLMRGQAAALTTNDARSWYDAAVAASGRTEDEIKACLDDPATMTNLRASMAGAEAAGVNRTPTFFVDGKMVDDSSLDALAAAIEPALQGR